MTAILKTDAPRVDNDRDRVAIQLSSLATKTKTAYEQAVKDFRDSQTVNSPMYFMGND